MNTHTDTETKTFEDFKQAMYNAALDYLDRGWSVIPIGLDTKSPLIKWKEYQSHQTTVDEVDTWFTEGVPTEYGSSVKYFNLGLVCGAGSGVVVVDADNPEAMEFAEKNNLTSPLYNDTPRGRHYFWLHPNDGQRFHNKVGGNPGHDWPAVDGLDFRGDGGYVLLPPSIKIKDKEVVGEYRPCEAWTHIELDDAPVWQGTKPALRDVTDAVEFTFEDMDLSHVRVATAEDLLPVWDQVEALTKQLGRKLTVGDSTDTWMIKYCGHMVRVGCVGQDLRDMADKFYAEFFEDDYSADETKRWLEQKCRSAEDMDKLNHKEDYDADGERKGSSVKELTIDADMEVEAEPIEARQDSIVAFPIGLAVDKVKDKAEQPYFCDPIIGPEQIVQIVGYNGHGKSMFCMGMCMAIACGTNFGPWVVERPAKVLYMDFDALGSASLTSRYNFWRSAVGNPGDNMMLWSPTVNTDEQGGRLKLDIDDGLTQAKVLINQVQPNIVVFDTIRSAYLGLEENNAQAWNPINEFMSEIKRAGCGAIMVHHRNKPGESGLGREAGSTAQLKDLDLQVIVTSVFEDARRAQMKGGELDGNHTIYMSSGAEKTPYGYFREIMEADPDMSADDLNYVSMIDMGKERNENANLGEMQFIGYANDSRGDGYIVSTLSPRMKVRELIGRHSKTIKQASDITGISEFQINKWEVK